jgi:hypothetical protein
MKFVYASLVVYLFVLRQILSCLGVGAQNSDSHDDALGILSKSFDSRREIQSVHAVSRVRHSQDGGPFSEKEYHFIYDGTKKRFFFDISLLSEEYCTCFPDSDELLAVLEIDNGVESPIVSLNPNVHIDLKRSDTLTVDQMNRRLTSRREKLIFPQFEYFGYSPRTILNYRHFDFSNFIEGLYAHIRQPDSLILDNSISMNNIIYNSQSMIDIRMVALHKGQTQRHTQRSCPSITD